MKPISEILQAFGLSLRMVDLPTVDHLDLRHAIEQSQALVYDVGVPGMRRHSSFGERWVHLTNSCHSQKVTDKQDGSRNFNQAVIGQCLQCLPSRRFQDDFYASTWPSPSEYKKGHDPVSNCFQSFEIIPKLIISAPPSLVNTPFAFIYSKHSLPKKPQRTGQD